MDEKPVLQTAKKTIEYSPSPEIRLSCKNNESVTMLNVTTYLEAGRARKKCPKCPNYVHAKSLACSCGHEFVEGGFQYYLDRQNGPEVALSEKGGQGRKQCGSCKMFVGVRTRICNCGFNFADKPKKEDIKKVCLITDEDKKWGFSFGYANPSAYVYAPAGSFSVPKSNSPEAFEEWVEKYICNEGKLFTPMAFRYILRNNSGIHLLEDFNSWSKDRLK